MKELRNEWILFQIQSRPFYIVFDTVMIHNNQLSSVMPILQKSKEVHILSDKKEKTVFPVSLVRQVHLFVSDKSCLRTINLSVNTIAMIKLIGIIQVPPPHQKSLDIWQYFFRIQEKLFFLPYPPGFLVFLIRRNMWFYYTYKSAVTPQNSSRVKKKKISFALFQTLISFP